MSLKSNVCPQRVYAVLRVFDVGKATCNMTIFIDPVGMAERGMLRANEGWLMKPLE